MKSGMTASRIAMSSFLLVSSVFVSSVFAGSVKTNSDAGFSSQSGDVGQLGTSLYVLYAKGTGVEVNKATSNEYTGPGAPVMEGGAAHSPSNIELRFGMPPAAKIYKPAVEWLNQPKPANKYNRQVVSSFSGHAAATGGMNNAVGTIPAKVSVVANVDQGWGGSAAGLAVDPVSLTPGSYPYEHVISLEMERDGEADYLAAFYTATDSRYPADLWKLEVEAPEGQPLLSTGDLVVSFMFNLDAIHDGVFTNADGSLFTDAGISALTQQIKNGFLGAVQVANGVVSLPDYALFPDDLLFHTSGGAEYGAGNAAAITQNVPEPSTAALALLTAALLPRIRRR